MVKKDRNQMHKHWNIQTNLRYNVLSPLVTLTLKYDALKTN